MHKTSLERVDLQARKSIDETAGREHKPNIVMRDQDTKFSGEFTETLTSYGLRTNHLQKTVPNLNGRCEKISDII